MDKTVTAKRREEKNKRTRICENEKRRLDRGRSPRSNFFNPRMEPSGRGKKDHFAVKPAFASSLPLDGDGQNRNREKTRRRK
ncbi:MAG: hypothetical protein ABFD44_07625, partial [Anaerolineaceae bacterium]